MFTRTRTKQTLCSRKVFLRRYGCVLDLSLLRALATDLEKGMHRVCKAGKNLISHRISKDVSAVGTWMKRGCGLSWNRRGKQDCCHRRCLSREQLKDQQQEAECMCGHAWGMDWKGQNWRRPLTKQLPKWELLVVKTRVVEKRIWEKQMD